MKPIITKHKGQWCIKDSDVMSSEPKRIILYWPIGKLSGSIDLLYYEGIEVEKTGLCYEYRLSTSRGNVYLYLKEQGKTKAIDMEVEEIPCPKVRNGIETEYRAGQWWKYLKSQGWVSA